MLRITHYKKTYGPAPVLQIENLELPAGLYWLKGENGSGKTTLLKSIAGLIPFDGNVDVENTSLRKQRRRYTQIVSFAEAEPVFPLFLTGNELLHFYLDTKGGEKAEAVRIAEDFGIAAFLKNKTGTYSSGMMKKLSLLLCFTGRPKLLLLDEPFVTLDVAAVAVLRRLIAERSKSASFLLSTHQELALDVPHQTLRIHRQTLQRETHAAGA